MTWFDDWLSKIRSKPSDEPVAPAPVAAPTIVPVPKSPPLAAPVAPPGAAPAPPIIRPQAPSVVIPAPRLTVDMLMRALGIGAQRATRWIYPIEEAMTQFEIVTREQRAAFLAQCGHESDLLLYAREIWGPTDEQRMYEPVTPKSRALGNTQAGDGFKYRGGGLIQLTGRYNFRRMGERLGVDLESNPSLIEAPQYAALSAGAYWHDHELNPYADRGEFDAISRAINLGNPFSPRTPNGMTNRRMLWDLCKHAYSIA